MNPLQWIEFIALYLVVAVVALAPLCLKKEPVRKDKVFGFRKRQLQSGGFGPDCPKLIRFTFHLLALTAFKFCPYKWIGLMVNNRPNLRARIACLVTEFFGWWGYSHRDQ